MSRTHRKKPVLFLLNALLLLVVSTHASRAQPAPANPKMTQAARQLLAYLYELSGRRIMTGQHNYIGHGSRHTERVHEITGVYPAVWGSDFGFAGHRNDKDAVDHRQDLVEEVKRQWEKGSVITLMWHACRPIDAEPCRWSEGVQANLSEAQWDSLMTPGTAVHLHWQRQVGRVAAYLAQLQEAGVPVLWRPYHEMNGGWFWWGNKRGEHGYSKLWRMLYDRLTRHHGLNNLIWVWNPNVPSYADAYAPYYPGSNYVDVLAADVYGGSYEQRFHDRLLELGGGKPIALGEVGRLPTPETLSEQPQWVWFMTWVGDFLDEKNTLPHIRDLYYAPRTLTREQVTFPH